MKEISVIELSELTGLTRSQIYYLTKKGKLIILNGKINYTDAMQVITTLPLKKIEINKEENFRQILNILRMENTTLKEQLNLAHERERHHLAELAIYRQHTLLNSTLNLGKNENKTPTEPDENSKTRTESTNTPPHTPVKANQGINDQKTTQNEIISQPLPIESHQSKTNGSEPTKKSTALKYKNLSEAQIQQEMKKVHENLANFFALALENGDVSL